MKKVFRNLGTLIPTVLLATLATVMKSIAALSKMDYVTGYFGGAVSVSIANWIIVALLLFLFATIFIKVETPSLKPSYKGALIYLPSGVFAVSLLFLSTELGRYVTSAIGSIFSPALLSHRSYVVALIAAVFAVFAIIHSALSAFIADSRSALRADFGMLSALFFALYTAFIFFRTGAAINQPQRILTEMTCLAASVFLLEETRISLGRVRWRSYFVFGGITALLAFYTAIPALLVYIFRGKIITSGIAELLFMLALLVLSVSRLIWACRLGEDKPSVFVTAINSVEQTEVESPVEEELSQISIEDVADDGERQKDNEENSGN